MTLSTWYRAGRSIGGRLGLLLALLLPAGCATSLHHGIRPLRPLELATAPYQGTVTTAFTGSLIYESGCLLMRVDGGGYVLPVWPDGSIFNGTSVIFHEPGKASQPIMVEQQVQIGGRPLAWLQLPGYPSFEHYCRAVPFLVSKVRPAD
jgi:hypothetical protein